MNGVKGRLQYIARKSAGLCVKCGFEPTDDGKVECRNCGEESNKRSKARYAKRVREADGELCSRCLKNKPTPGLKSCASCRIDAKIAGWWVWGICQWIGSGWCAERKPSRQLPHVGSAGRGVHRKLPHVGDAGMGVHRKLPHVGDAGRGGLFEKLTDRLRRVRVCCGDWSRVTGDSVTWRHGLTGVLLDPPYQDGDMEYVAGHGNVSQDVAKWAIENGDNPLMRIALCGYEGEHDMPASWECVHWKATGGYSSDLTNSRRERIWFSPHCLGGKQRSLF